jgi:class 3 adenylate cyclase
LGEQPTLEDRAKEILAVLNAVGSKQAAVVSNGAYGLFAIFFAATYPRRTSALVLDGCFARLAWAPDYPIGIPKELLDQTVAEVPTNRAQAGLRFAAPSAMSDPEFVALYERHSRSQRAPSVTKALTEAFVSTDLRQALPAIQAPTLVLHRRGDRWVRRPQAEYLAKHIDDATLVDLPGDDNLIFVGDSDADIDEIEEFVTGERRTPEGNRVLATVLFTDIVGSTELAANVGDRRFKEMLDSHDRAVHRQLERFGGRMVNTAGDGVFATFDGPGRAIRCACAIRDALGTLGIDVRSGLHTGEIELRGEDATGMAVHIGARASALADAGEVLVSSTVKDLVAGSGIEFEDRGDHELKGVPGTWRLFAIRG